MYHKTYKNFKEMNNMDYLIETLVNARNSYLKNNNKTVLDDTPFQEFRLSCQGDTIDQARKFRLSVAEKLKKKQRIKFRYDPLDKNEKFKPDAYKFPNTSGGINNTKNKILMI